MNERRREAALRVASTYRPLPEIFAALRAEAGEPVPPAEALADPVADPLAEAFAAAAEGATDADDLALTLLLAGEETFAALAGEGAADAALDAVLAVLQPYAAAVVAGTAPARPSAELLDRVRDVARAAAATGG
jgi:hypothetical protein